MDALCRKGLDCVLAFPSDKWNQKLSREKVRRTPQEVLAGVPELPPKSHIISEIRNGRLRLLIANAVTSGGRGCQRSRFVGRNDSRPPSSLLVVRGLTQVASETHYNEDRLKAKVSIW